MYRMRVKREICSYWAQNFDPVREWSTGRQREKQSRISLQKCVVTKPLVCNENEGINRSI